MYPDDDLRTIRNKVGEIMKSKGHIRVLLALLIVSGMIVSPIAAATEQYTLTGFQEFNVFDVKKDMYDDVYNLTFDKSTDDQAITLIHFKTPMDHTVSFKIYYGAGNSVSGTASTAWNTSLLPLHTTTSTIVFNGETKEYSYLDTNPEYDYYLSGYAKKQSDNSTGIIVYNAGYGSFDNDLAVFMSVPNIAGNLIYRVDLVSDAPFDVDISYGTASEVASSVSKGILDIAWEWMNFAIGIAGTLKDFLFATFYWIKFIFVDNLLITVALYFSISMAVAATKSRDIFQFYRRFLSDQRKFFEFILGLWQTLINIISSFRGIFRL